MDARRCGECAAPLAPDQSYCLVCGARAGSPSPELQRLLERVRDGAPPGQRSDTRDAAPAPILAGGARHGLRLSLGSLQLPPPRICALLVLAFLGFGVLLGAAAGSRVDDTLAASARHIKLVLPASAAAASAASSAGESAGSAEQEPPATETTETPAAASSTTTGSPSAGSGSGAGAGSSTGEGSTSKSGGGASTSLPHVKHVFVILLSDEPYAAVFGPESSAHYLAQQLEHRGELLIRYDAVAHEELANGVALISGQGPTPETAVNCPTYSDIAPAGLGADGQVLGNGCVYPASTQTLAGQLTAKHLKWRAYVQGAVEAAGPGACVHPALGEPDPSSAAGPGSPYATFRNPFMYFHSITDSSSCGADDVGLGALKSDLASVKRTPSLSYVLPDRCHDGSPEPCAAGAAAGLLPADGFLEEVVPEILASKAYKENGLLVITVDQAPSSGEFADSSSCCGQPRFPNLAPTSSGSSTAGGGTVGALLLSPFVKAASTNEEAFNHFSLLRTIEDLFGLKHLGYAALSGVKPFGASMFTAHSGG